MEDGDYFVGEFGGGAGAVRYRGGLEAIEFVEFVVYGGVAAQYQYECAGGRVDGAGVVYAMKW